MYIASYIYQSVYIYILRQKSFGQEKKASCDLSGFSFVYNRLHWKKGLLFHFKFVFPFFQAISMSFFSQFLKFHTKKKIQFIHNWTGTTHFYVMNCLFSRTSISLEMIKNLTFRYLNINIPLELNRLIEYILKVSVWSINPSIHTPTELGKSTGVVMIFLIFLIIKQYSDKTLYASSSICSSCFDKIMMVR